MMTGGKTVVEGGRGRKREYDVFSTLPEHRSLESFSCFSLNDD